MSEKIGILGAGALGAFYGAKLARAGRDVHFLMNSDYAAVKKNGLTVQSVDGDFSLPEVNVYNEAAALGPCDLVIVGLKSTSNHLLGTLLPPMLGPATRVLTLQNGLGNEDAILKVMAEHTGESEEALKPRVCGGVAFLCSSRGEPGVINHTAHGKIALAETAGVATDETHRIAQHFTDAGIDVKVKDSLLYIRWKKLIWNVPFNGLGVALLQADVHTVLNDPNAHELARNLMWEVLDAARADNVELDPDDVQGNIDATMSMGFYRSSMQIDDAEGRPLEVEAIVGEPLRRAQAAGIKTPLMQFLYCALKRHDAKAR